MKTKIDPGEFISRLKKLVPLFSRRGPLLASMGAFVLCLAVVIWEMNSGMNAANPDEFEVGRVAERDVVAEHPVTYEDKEATLRRQEAQERLVPAVYLYDFRISDDIKNIWKQFSSLVDASLDVPPDAFIQTIQTEFPGYFSRDALDLLYTDPERSELLNQASAVLDSVLERGIFNIPGSSMDQLNQEVLEIIRQSGARAERERVPLSSIVTRENINEAIESRMKSGYADPNYHYLIPVLLGPFVKENVIYSPEDTIQRIIETRSKTEPVIKYIDQGSKIIKKGFIITEEDMLALGALNMSRRNDIGSIFSRVLLLLLLLWFMMFFCGKRIMGRNLTDPETYLICVLSALYIAGSVLTRELSLGPALVPVSIVLPTALVVMLPSILIHPRLALIMAISLPLGALISGAYTIPSFIFALVSGVTASFVLPSAEKRMDLLKAGFIIAALNCAAMAAILLGQHAEAGLYPVLLFWAAFNGIASGMLVLGFLPPLEHVLNAATSFRLIELSDLNEPILRRLFTTAPGTYSHSIMVANLAETACQDIGANAILARVGAYYHDIGKMENPYYFVENQTDHNPHDEIAPRLSATVIRSHVKLGVEKARQLGLPREVTDIIAEHHGNSVITWFYSKALKQEAKNSKKVSISEEDFCYQGNPPRSRESAVVMLADVTEAAIRTLDKPTTARMEKFIQDLFDSKVEHGQLARSELTFQDLETIKKAFVRVLAGYYHSRIEYPKLEKSKAAGQGPEPEGDLGPIGPRRLTNGQKVLDEGAAGTNEPG